MLAKMQSKDFRNLLLYKTNEKTGKNMRILEINQKFGETEGEFIFF